MGEGKKEISSVTYYGETNDRILKMSLNTNPLINDCIEYLVLSSFRYLQLQKGINCTLPSLLEWDLKQEIPYLCTHHTAHT